MSTTLPLILLLLVGAAQAGGALPPAPEREPVLRRTVIVERYAYPAAEDEDPRYRPPTIRSMTIEDGREVERVYIPVPDERLWRERYR